MNTDSPKIEDYETMSIETMSFSPPIDAMQGEALAENIKHVISAICEGTGSDSFAGVNVIYRMWSILPGNPEAEKEEDRLPRRVFGTPDASRGDFLIRCFRKKKSDSSLILPLNP